MVYRSMISGLLIAFGAAGAFAQNFGAEDGGPSGIPGAIILEKDGDLITVVGGGDGTGTADPADEMDGITSDQDDDDVVICISVDADADGVILMFPPAVNVPHQAQRNQEAGDMFVTTEGWNTQTGLLDPPVSMGLFDNVVVINQGRGWGDNTGFGLQPNEGVVFFNPPNVPIDSVDSFAVLQQGPGAGLEAYFSMRNGSPSLATLPGNGNLNRGADIFFDPDITQSTQQVPEFLYAPGVAFGLVRDDDIDAFVVIDRAKPKRQFDPIVDTVFFSLAPGSPSLGDEFGPGDIFVTNGRGGFQLFARAEEMGLGRDDNVTAMHFEPIINDSVEETLRRLLPRPPKVGSR